MTAGDFTNHPASGVDTHRITDELQASRDPRIKYIIANGWIMSGQGEYQPWVWRRYTGSNPHNSHMHISVKSQQSLGDDRRPWNIPSFGAAPPPTPEVDLLPHQHTALMDIRDQIAGRWHSFLGPPPEGELGLTMLEFAQWIHKNVIDQRARTAAQNESIQALASKVSAQGDIDVDALVASIEQAISDGIDDATVNVDVRVNGRPAE